MLIYLFGTNKPHQLRIRRTLAAITHTIYSISLPKAQGLPAANQTEFYPILVPKPGERGGSDKEMMRIL